MEYPNSIKKLIKEFSKLPSVGPKTAERYVFYLLQQNRENLKEFAEAIDQLKNNLKICQSCYAVSENDPCQICQDEQRKGNIICVVANTRDLISLEKTGIYKGKYFVLGGTINLIKGIGPENINANRLIKKINSDQVEELILATNPDMEGETTAIYLTKELKKINNNLKISRLARGLPTGSSLEYADGATLGDALKNRKQI